MSAILEPLEINNYLPTRFTQVKRINNNGEVNHFYKDCIKRLLNVSQWNYVSLFNFSYKITAHDKLGLPVSGPLKQGDCLKIVTKINAESRKFLWFTVENIHQQEEPNFSEESLSITLREIQNPELITTTSSIETLKSKCELHLRRLINTISIDIKIANQHTIDQSKSFLNYFSWEIFAKQILLQL